MFHPGLLVTDQGLFLSLFDFVEKRNGNALIFKFTLVFIVKMLYAYNYESKVESYYFLPGPVDRAFFLLFGLHGCLRQQIFNQSPLFVRTVTVLLIHPVCMAFASCMRV